MDSLPPASLENVHPALVCWWSVESHGHRKMASFHVYRERRVELEALLQEMKVNRKKADRGKDRPPGGGRSGGRDRGKRRR